MSQLLTGGTTLLPDGWSKDPVAIREGVIVEPSQIGNGEHADVAGLSLVPGFIDLQINGGWGFDLQRRPQDLWLLAGRLPEIGVTSFLPTLTSNGFQHLGLALETLAAGPPDGWSGAEPIGWHLEGPWLSPEKAGAHDRQAILSPTAAPPLSRRDGVRLVTLAPELPGAAELTAALVGKGVVVSMGHSAASIEQARAGAEAGATMGTHLFNAMDGLHHRAPGLAAAMLLDDLYVGLIADGHHVAPDLVALAWRIASDRVVLVSDAVAVLGETDDPVARLADGTIAGAVVGLDQCVRNVMAFAEVELARSVAAASARPAEVLGLVDRGHFRQGARADIVGLDADLKVALTIVAGRTVYERRATS